MAHFFNEIRVWGLCLGLCWGACAQGKEDQGQEIRDLGADSYLDREQAEAALWLDGKKSLNLLTALTLSNDPEAAWRARKILRWVDMEITPETPPEVVELVEGYLTAPSAQERNRIYLRLLELEAYVPLFRLPDYITDKVVARALAERVGELAEQVAEEMVYNGQDEQALQVLEDAKAAGGGQARWVALISAMGLREKYWPKLSDKERIMMARWEGDVETIKELVDSEHEIQITLKLLEGTPLPYLEKAAETVDSRGFRARLVKATLTNEEESEANRKLLNQFLDSLNEKKTGQRSDVLELLVKAGYLEESRPALEADFPVNMFEYYESTEQIEEAFRVLGLEVKEPVPQEWIDQTLALVGKSYDYYDPGCRRLMALAQFYWERGERLESERLLSALLEKFTDMGPDEADPFLAYLSGAQRRSTDRVQVEFAIQHIQDQEKDIFESFLGSVFMDEAGASSINRFLEEEWEPELNQWDRARAIFAVLGREVKFPKETEEAILTSFVESTEKEESSSRWENLLMIALRRGDMPLVERAAKTLMGLRKNEGEGLTLDFLGFVYFADGRFAEALEIFENVAAESEGNRIDLLPYQIVALELSGEQDKAREKTVLLEKLALGDGRKLATLAGVWGQVGYWEEQYALQRRALLQLRSDSRSWLEQTTPMAEVAYRTRRWNQSAAMREVSALAGTMGYELSLNDTPDLYLQFALQERGTIEFSRAMAAFEKNDATEGERWFGRLVDRSALESFFADDVSPELRRAGLHEQAERLWAAAKPSYQGSMELFPKAHNTLNTAAWVASRAACDLDEAAVWVDQALEGRPGASAYLDTKAEVFFAQGDREEALNWSDQACQRSEGVETLRMLRLQYFHFRDDPFPLTTVGE